RVNVLVDNSRLKGAPVILETNPTYSNLIGRIEHRAQLGALVTDFNMIRGGALHRANGGYLITDARAILRQPVAWEALKRALRNEEIRIEELAQQVSLISTVGLEPEPIPLEVKVVLIGDPLTYYLLYAYDEQVQKLFKVRADFAPDMDRTRENMMKYALFIGARCQEENLCHFDLSGVAKVVEYGSRLAEHKEKLTTRFAHIADIVREASYWAGQGGTDLVTAAHVQKAIEEKVYRSNRIEERVRELIEEGTLLVDTEGEVVGQVNGLSIVSLGDYDFGKPSRITAKTYLGKAGVINIEREAELSGRIHDKGVMILSGYMGGKYAQDKPLSLSASLCFEQSYEGVEGDSASSTELYALLSSLSGFPLKQDIAVTGSVNQQGEVQPVGEVTKKIEGFFDVCRVKGLTGEQGVIIPEQNVRNLMLREDVVEAVEKGQFHIYPVRSIDEGISVLTGQEAGGRQPDGTYPPGTVNYEVDKRLGELAERLKEFREEVEKS
ncbi:MAG: Lon protease family protein, partial [Anaerolineae bacterium]